MNPVLVRYWGSHVKNPRISVSLARMVRHAIARGWRFHLVCSGPPADASWLTPLEEAGARMEYLPRQRRNFDVRCIRNVRRMCRGLGASVLHCDNMHTSPMIGSWLARVPVRLWSKRSMQPCYEEGRTANFRDRIAPSVRVTCALATRVLAVSSSVRNELLDLGVPAGKCQVFPNAVDFDSPRNFDRNQSRRELGLSDGEMALVTVGHAVPVKGWDLLLEAFVRVARRLPRLRLVFVGSCDAEHEREFYAALRRVVEDAKLGDRVLFTGHVPNVFVPLAAADLFAMPSRSEGCCNALQEGLAAGCPCISTVVGNAPDIIRSGENGLLVPRNDPAALASGMVRLAEDADLRRKFTSASRVRFAPTEGEYVERLFDLYESLLRQARGQTSGRCSDKQCNAVSRSVKDHAAVG